MKANHAQPHAVPTPVAAAPDAPQVEADDEPTIQQPDNTALLDRIASLEATLAEMDALLRELTVSCRNDLIRQRRARNGMPQRAASRWG